MPAAARLQRWHRRPGPARVRGDNGTPDISSGICRVPQFVAAQVNRFEVSS